MTTTTEDSARLAARTVSKRIAPQQGTGREFYGLAHVILYLGNVTDELSACIGRDEPATPRLLRESVERLDAVLRFLRQQLPKNAPQPPQEKRTPDQLKFDFEDR